MKNIYKILGILLIFISASFADESLNTNKALAPKDSTVQKLEQEVSLRDSLMDLQNNACTIEKDSLRKVIDVEKAKSENWEKSYDTIKKNNEVCAQALSVSIGVNEKKKEKEEQDKQAAAMMTTTSFLGGIGAGLLIMWLIMK